MSETCLDHPAQLIAWEYNAIWYRNLHRETRQLARINSLRREFDTGNGSPHSFPLVPASLDQGIMRFFTALSAVIIFAVTIATASPVSTLSTNTPSARADYLLLFSGGALSTN